MRQAHAPERRVERGEQHVLRQHPCPGQPIEQCRLARIGVADDSDHRKRYFAALGAVQIACAAHRFQFPLEPGDLLLKSTAVGFDLCFARSTEKTGATALALKVGPASNQPALLIVEMSEIDLKRAL